MDHRVPAGCACNEDTEQRLVATDCAADAACPSTRHAACWRSRAARIDFGAEASLLLSPRHPVFTLRSVSLHAHAEAGRQAGPSHGSKHFRKHGLHRGVTERRKGRTQKQRDQTCWRRICTQAHAPFLQHTHTLAYDLTQQQLFARELALSILRIRVRSCARSVTRARGL